VRRPATACEQIDGTGLDRWSGTGVRRLDHGLTAVLVFVTIYYAIQNRRMAQEMRRAREALIRPKLALDFHRLGPTAMTLGVKNIGPGQPLP